MDNSNFSSWRIILVFSGMKSVAPEHVKRLAELFRTEKFDFYIVGGAIRSQLLGKKIDEWDAATDATPDEIIKLFKKAGATHIGTIGKRFGTVTATLHGEPIEVTTYRTEQYEKNSRNPQVKFGESLEEDLSRRDFTVNAIALDPTSDKLIDPHNGKADLEHKIIRAVGDPNERFDEDPLRMLRAVRFATTLNFSIEQNTQTAISHNKERFGVLSTERVQQELNKILLSDRPSQGIELIKETGLISYIIPELIPSINIEFDPREHKDIYGHIIQVLDNTPSKLEQRWCAILHDLAKPITRKKIGGEYHFLGHENVGAKMAREILTRLKYPNSFVRYVSKLVRLHQRLPNNDGNWTDGAVRRFVRDAGDCLDDLFIFAKADSTGKNEKKNRLYENHRQELIRRIKKLEEEAEIAKIKSPLTGEELMEIFHRKPGPWIKPIKEELLRLVIEGELKEDQKEEARRIAKKLIDQDNTNK